MVITELTDKERLDWLGENAARLGEIQKMATKPDCESCESMDIRDAIDYLANQ